MNTQQNVVAAGGLALIAGNYWTQQRPLITKGALNSKASASDQQVAHSTIFRIGLELLFVAVATLIAGAGGAAGNAMAAVIIALAVLWLIRFQGSKK